MTRGGMTAAAAVRQIVEKGLQVKGRDLVKKTVAIGKQSFAALRENDYFYIDKTDFIRQWWESGDDVTLIARPRRFGKTLNMDMLNCFFSNEYEGRADLFEGLSVWEDEEFGEKYRALQGTFPVIFLSFADVKDSTFENAKKKIYQTLIRIYSSYTEVMDRGVMTKQDIEYVDSVGMEMSEAVATTSLKTLTDIMYRMYGRKTVILLDEYDTPLQEAYVNGYWDEMVSFITSFFNSTFKTIRILNGR